MKLKLSHLLLLYIGALLLIAFGAAVILGSLLYNQLTISAEGGSFFSFTRLGLVLGGLILLAFGVFCLSLPHRMKQGRSDFVVQKTQSGEMRISLQAIESIIQKSLSQHEEVKLQKLQVINTRTGVEINANTSVAGNVNLPLAVNAIQKHIRQQLLATSGIEVKEIRVTVDRTDSPVTSSQYQVRQEELELPGNPQAVAGSDDSQKQASEVKEGTHGQV